MDNIDLRLLQLFEEIHKTASLSKAANKLGLTQPGASLALGRLRRHFGDPLFVRTPAGMKPSQLSLNILPNVTESIAAVRATLEFRQEFSPKESRRTFHLSMTELGQLCLLPSLLSCLSELAPQVCLDVATLNSEIHSDLAAGLIDIAIGVLEPMREHLYQQALGDAPFVVVARKAHPRIGESITLSQYQLESHVLVTTFANGTRLANKAIEDLGLVRKVVARVPNLTSLSAILSSTDYICTLPQRVGDVMTKTAELKTVTPPFAIPGMVSKQHWHARQDKDPGNIWLRGLIASIYK